MNIFKRAFRWLYPRETYEVDVDKPIPNDNVKFNVYWHNEDGAVVAHVNQLKRSELRGAVFQMMTQEHVEPGDSIMFTVVK